MADQGFDRRQSPRFPLILQVAYRGAAQPILDCTENLSANGLFIRTELAFNAGDRVPLILSFPGLLEPVELEVEVVRRRSSSTEGSAGVAVKLLPSALEDRRKLERIAQAVGQGKASVQEHRVLLAEDNEQLAQ